MHVFRQAHRMTILLATMVLASTASAELVEIVWDTGRRFDYRRDVGPGKFVEVCGRLAKDDAVHWSFQAEAPLDFNVHYHEGKKVEYPARQDGIEQMKGTLPVGVDQDYCWMWTNKSTRPVSLRVLLAR